ncbi:MAG: flagellin [Bdellovibrionales bacterium]
MTLSALGIDGLAFDTGDGAREALEVLDDAQRTVNGYRANLGALQNRLISTSENLSTAEENFQAANSRMRDTDVARASADLARNNILNQASVAMLAQANQQPGMALRLIG